jgi:hypothetical protein
MSGSDPTWNLYSGDSESYFLPYTLSSFGSQTAVDPTITVQVDGKTLTAPLDTGSRGASIPQASVPDISPGPDDPAGYLFYWSSGREIVGYWHTLTLTFPGATGVNTGNAVATASAPVLIVQQIIDLAGNWPNGTRATNETIIPSAGNSFLNFGIGFDRTGEGTSPEDNSYNQNYNPFLNLSQMSSGDMVSGYILTQDGVQLGLTAANTKPTADDGLSAFAYQQLLPTGFNQVSGSPPDWQAGTGSVTLDGTPYASGQTVLDIGIGNALLSLPSPPSPITPSATTTVDNGSSITVNFLNSDYNVGYDFMVGNTADVMTPQNVTWAAIQTGNQQFSENVDQTTLFNSGRNAINGFNYLYDATNGYIGLQLNTPTSQTGAFLNPVVSLQGSVTPPDGFSTDYPILVQNPTTIAAAGTASFSGPVDITTGGSLQLSGAITVGGTVTIGPNATLELSAGSNPTGLINFGGIGATLLIDNGVTPTATIGDLQQGDFIDVSGVSNGSVAVAGTLLTVSGTGGPLTLTLDTDYSGQFRASPDGNGGTLISYVSNGQPYVIPIYHSTEAGVDGKQNFLIYASVGGGPLNPYLLDSGSPNMFSVYGSWWPGNSTPVAQQGSLEITYSSGTTYAYNQVTTNVSLGNQGGTVLAASNNVGVGQITNLIVSGVTTSPAQSFINWQSAVAAGSYPIATDSSYGNFGIGLTGSNSLATVLTQLPIANDLLNGYIVQSGGISADTGTLTVGLDPSLVAAWEASPNTISLQMDPTGVTLPNPDGNTVDVGGANRAQTNSTTLTLIGGGETFTLAVPLVLDTGGGNNDIIYTGNQVDLSQWVQNGDMAGQVINGTTLELTGTTLGNELATILDYIVNPNVLPAGGNTTVDTSGNAPADLRINPGINLFYDYNVMFDVQDGLVLLQPIACFAAGTRIATARGGVAVEDLREGDLVPTRIAGTLQPIGWIGHRRVACRRHPRPDQVWPVRIAAGAFGPGLPERALWLSPDHAVYAQDVLIPVKYLINGRTIVQVPIEDVSYYHIELPCHDIVVAEGLPVESYLDAGGRDSFANGGGVTRLHPDFSTRNREAHGCAPLVIVGPQVDAVRQVLQRRAARRKPMPSSLEFTRVQEP